MLLPLLPANHHHHFVTAFFAGDAAVEIPLKLSRLPFPASILSLYPRVRR